MGHGLVGEKLNKALLDQGTATLVIDLNAETVRTLKRQGQPVLFADAVRSLGFAARLNSGYLHNPEARRGDTGATHAWAEVFVPGAGWITFDPTNRSVGGLNLIPVAVARDISQIAPVTGSFIGMTDAFHTMLVDVNVEEVANSDCK